MLLVFGKFNPVMVQGVVLAGLPVTEGWSPNALDCVSSGDLIRVDPENRTITVLQKAPDLRSKNQMLLLNVFQQGF